MRTRTAELDYRYREPEPARERLGWTLLARAIIITAVATIATAPAWGQTYVSVHGGASVWDCTSNSCEIEANRPGGYRVQVALGRHVTDRWAVEVEASWQRHDIHGINPGDGRTLSGDGNELHAGSLMGNALLSLPEISVIEPYVMAGAGITRRSIDGGGKRPLDGDAWTVSGQIGAGARYALTDALSLDARYVYWRALGTDIDAPAGLGNGLDLDHWSHSVMIGLVWELG